MSLGHSPSIVTNGLVMYYDMNNTKKSWKGAPTTNYVSNPSTMSGWSNYSNTANGTPAPFITEFGTTGYKMDWVGSWNGIAKTITLPSTGTYTFSAWIKWIGGSTNVTGGAVYVSGWGGADSATYRGQSNPGEWQRISLTLACTTTTLSFYLICWGGTNNADYSSWQVTMPQVEAGSVATPFVDGTRTTTNNLVDLTGNNTFTATSLTYNSDNTFSFNGTNNQISSPYKPSGARSFFIWVKFNTLTVASGYQLNGTQEVGAYSYIGIVNGGNIYYYAGAATGGDIGVAVTVSTWVNLGFVLNADGSRSVYKNGVSVHTNTGAIGNLATAGFTIGALNGNYWVNGDVPVVSFYNRALTADEVAQNFNAHRGRYGI